MKIRNYMDALNPISWRILRVFIRMPNVYTGRQMSIITGLNNKTCSDHLELLCNEWILSKRIAGKAYLYELEQNHFTEKVLTPIINEEERLYTHILNKIKRTFSKYCTAIIVYGSYARGEETSDSDLDVCFIVSDEKPDFEERMDAFRDELRSKYTIHISPHILTESEVKEKSHISVLQDIKNEGKWIKGERFEIVRRLWVTKKQKI